MVKDRARPQNGEKTRKSLSACGIEGGFLFPLNIGTVLALCLGNG